MKSKMLAARAAQRRQLAKFVSNLSQNHGPMTPDSREFGLKCVSQSVTKSGRSLSRIAPGC